MVKALKGWGACEGTHADWGESSHIDSEHTSVFEENLSDSSIEGKMPLYLEEIFSDIKQGDKESAKRKIENLIEGNKWNSNEVYGYLLLVAANRGEIEVAEFCKDNGACLDHKDYKERTPLGLAKHCNRVNMVKVLKGWGAHEADHYEWGRPIIKPSSSLEIPSCSKGKQGRDKKTCTLI